LENIDAAGDALTPDRGVTIRYRLRVNFVKNLMDAACQTVLQTPMCTLSHEGTSVQKSEYTVRTFA
jgi:hypothetical protein